MGWQVLIRRGSDLATVGALVDYLELQVVPRFRAAGAWSLTVPDGSPVVPLLRAAGAGARFFLAGQQLMSGPRRAYGRKRGDSDGGGGTWTFTGVSDDWYVTDARLAWPKPAALVTGQTDAYYKVTGLAAETALRQLVDVNAGPSAQASRQVPHLVLEPDQARGTNVTTQARFDRLGDVLAAVATAGGLGYRVEQQARQLVFVIYEPADHSNTAKFSFGLGNLTDYDYEVKEPTATDVVIGAGGDGTARHFELWTAHDAAWPDTIEAFVDRRDLDPADPATPDAIQTEALQQLAEGSASASLSVTPVDTPQLRYGRDYGLGDTITVEDITDVVREVTLTSSAQDGDRVTPTVGGERATRAPSIITRLARVGRRVRSIEIRK